MIDWLIVGYYNYYKRCLEEERRELILKTLMTTMKNLSKKEFLILVQYVSTGPLLPIKSKETTHLNILFLLGRTHCKLKDCFNGLIESSYSEEHFNVCLIHIKYGICTFSSLWIFVNLVPFDQRNGMNWTMHLTKRLIDCLRCLEFGWCMLKLWRNNRWSLKQDRFIIGLLEICH